MGNRELSQPIRELSVPGQFLTAGQICTEHRHPEPRHPGRQQQSRGHSVCGPSRRETTLQSVIGGPGSIVGVMYLRYVGYIIVRRAGLLWSQQDFEWRWSVPLFKCLTVLEFSVILFDLCLLITFFNFIMNYVPIVTFWIFTYHKIWILSIMFCFIWSYWIIYFLACLEVSWRVVS